MAIFDISKKDYIKEIYTLDEVEGGIIIFLPSAFEELNFISSDWLWRHYI